MQGNKRRRVATELPIILAGYGCEHKIRGRQGASATTIPHTHNFGETISLLTIRIEAKGAGINVRNGAPWSGLGAGEYSGETHRQQAGRFSSGYVGLRKAVSSRKAIEAASYCVSPWTEIERIVRWYRHHAPEVLDDGRLCPGDTQ